ncbi:MAG: DNA-binding protein [Caulobacteraceae bacterium]|nr:MAG: DNA-binding protein [Caulobacteraceae bacterium]
MMEPRLLTEKEAAAYLSLPVTEVRKLTFGRLRMGVKVRYDRKALDANLDAMSGLAPLSAGAALIAPPDTADAAFERFAQSHPDVARHS